MIAAVDSFQGGSRPGEVARLRDPRLAGYAYASLPPDAPERAALRREYLAALARHHQIKRELRPLLAAWHANGIDVLLFKGFALAEFEYPAPGMRYHGDVDAVVRDRDARRALQIASELGWSVEGNSFELGITYGHTVCCLTRDGGATRVDLQRFVIHRQLPLGGVQRRVTDAVWSRSRTVSWNTVEVRVPHPVDAIVVLALQRCWGDGWGLKPHDVLDMRLLAERIGSSWRDEVLDRARELRCARTVELFVRRCDPDAGMPALGLPTPRERRRLAVRSRLERPLGSELWIARLYMLPTAARVVPPALLRVLAVLWRLRRRDGIGTLLADLTPAQAAIRPRTALERLNTMRGIRWAIRLLPGGREGRCLVRSLAAYGALRRQGFPVQFVSGVRRAPGGVTGHAWVELDGRVLPELDEPDNPRWYAVNVRFPISSS
jgi:hypothetical protein